MRHRNSPGAHRGTDRRAGERRASRGRASSGWAGHGARRGADDAGARSARVVSARDRVRTSPGRDHARAMTATMLGGALIALGPTAALPGSLLGLADEAAVGLSATGSIGAVVSASPPAPAPAPAPVAAVAPAPTPRTDGCGPRPGAVDEVRSGSVGSVGAMVLELAQLMCGPLGPAAGLPPTTLEAEEPERLYALVDADHAVRPLRYAPDDLVRLQGGPYEARREVARHLDQLLEAAGDAGYTQLSIQSGFRDHDTQAGSHEDWVRRVGEARAERVSAQAGHSEHQLGLAVDLTGPCGFSCTGETPEERWVADNAHRFGFIVRYPEGGRDVTGYAYEPWHLRYVGPRAAWGMHLAGEVYWERFHEVALQVAEDDGLG